MRDPVIMERVKQILKSIVDVAPGKAVELRIPPYAAIQCVGGTTHRRGTPPNVVEMDAHSLIKLSNGSLSWTQGISEGLIHASGVQSDLSNIFELVRISK